MSTTAENITFMIVRGVVALAIVGVGFFCLSKGIEFFRLPRVEAEQILIEILGLRISASGLGAVIFGTGLALCWVGKQAAPRRFEWKKETEPDAQRSSTSTVEQPNVQRPAAPPPEQQPTPKSGSFRTTEGTVLTEGPRAPTVRLD